MAAGDLDPTFGQGGKVVSSFPGILTSTALQSDGKIVAVGATPNPTRNAISLQVARFNTDGTIDTSFSDNGLSPNLSDTNFNSTNFVADVAIQPDGRILVAGTTIVPGLALPESGFLVRYLPNGSLDTSFGVRGDGVVNQVDQGRGGDFNSVTLQGNQILVGASLFDPAFTRRSFALFRFSASGAPDTAFGRNGVATTDLVASNNEALNDVALLNDGTIVAVGASTLNLDSGPSQFVAVRFDADGERLLNQTTTDFGGTRQGAFGVAVQPDGRIVAVGMGGNQANPAFALARYNPDLSLDPSFGNGGLVVTPIGGRNDTSPFNPTTGVGGASDLALQSNGQIVVVGGASQFTVARYTPNGILDTSFGSNGLITTDFDGTNDSARSVLIQSDGRIVAGGFLAANQVPSFTLARYIGDSQVVAAEGIFVQAPLGRRFVHPVARFFTNVPNATAASFSVLIRWGDGSQATIGRVVPNFRRAVPGGPGTFFIVGAHTYRRKGLFQTSVLIQDAGGQVAEAQGFVSVGLSRDHERNLRHVRRVLGPNAMRLARRAGGFAPLSMSGGGPS